MGVTVTIDHLVEDEGNELADETNPFTFNGYCSWNAVNGSNCYCSSTHIDSPEIEEDD